jgi:hypothetical protein
MLYPVLSFFILSSLAIVATSEALVSTGTPTRRGRVLRRANICLAWVAWVALSCMFCLIATR